MAELILKYIYNYIDSFLLAQLPDLVKLISVIDLNKFYNNKLFVVESNNFISFQFSHFLLHEKQNQENTLIFWVGDTILHFSKTEWLLLFLNCFLVNLFFFKSTSLTFWLLPSVFMLICGLVLLFFVKPLDLNTRLWFLSKIFMLSSFFYQLFLIYIYILFLKNGFILKVGLLGIYNLPFNLFLAKLVCFLIILFLLCLTLIIYLDFYSKILFLIKPELCSVLFFLGFSSGMIFLQNDLFSLFLYFEILSFCIYGLLFFQKRTNAQLHSLVRYVLFSLWVSTCYIIGIAFYLSGSNTSTSLSIRSNFDTFFAINSDVLVDFEIIFAITFFLIYFLFKLGAGPFYTWTVEVYNACSTASLLVVSLVPKLVYFPILFFILFYNFIDFYFYWSNLLLGLSLLTCFIGAFGILLSEKLKEIYAWSSVVHTGNLLILLSCMSTVSLTFLIFYLISYCLVSVGFIVLITSLRNNTTGRFIKTINELNSLPYLNSTFSLLSIIVLASAAGFTPFISFFMKFSVLSLVSSHFGISITILLGLLNIIGSIAYLWMLWNIISFNLNFFTHKTKDYTPMNIELVSSYFIAWLYNVICVLIIFSFIFYKDFITIFSFYDKFIYL